MRSIMKRQTDQYPVKAMFNVCKLHMRWHLPTQHHHSHSPLLLLFFLFVFFFFPQSMMLKIVANFNFFITFFPLKGLVLA